MSRRVARGGGFDPRPGLRALLDQINDVLVRSGRAPIPAAANGTRGSGSPRLGRGAGPQLPLLAAMAVDTQGPFPGPVPGPGNPDGSAGGGDVAAGVAAGQVALDPPDAGAPPAAEGFATADHADSWKLVVAAQAGDGEAFGRLYDRYVGEVYRFILYRVNDRALAEDFTSETFLRALNRIGSVTYQGRDIGAWFVAIARNLVYDWSKSARRRLEVMTAEQVEGDEFAPSPESAVLDSFTSQRLMEAIGSLGDEQRDCVMLRFVHGFSVAETAAVMGKNESSIKALQHRAVKKLAGMVGGELR